MNTFKIIPSTPEEDAAEMRRVWRAQGLSKMKPYGKNDQLLAIGGCIRNGKLKRLHP
jgi:hypothetical protein